MRNILAEAVAELHIEPGQTYRTTVDDYDLEIRRRPVAPTAAPSPQAEEPADDESSRFADMVMLDPWVDLGTLPSPGRITVQAKFGPLPWPDPPVIPPDDEVLE